MPSALRNPPRNSCPLGALRAETPLPHHVSQLLKSQGRVGKGRESSQRSAGIEKGSCCQHGDQPGAPHRSHSGPHCPRSLFGGKFLGSLTLHASRKGVHYGLVHRPPHPAPGPIFTLCLPPPYQSVLAPSTRELEAHERMHRPVSPFVS